jgi:hypothetical protein
VKEKQVAVIVKATLPNMSRFPRYHTRGTPKFAVKIDFTAMPGYEFYTQSIC